MRVVLTFASLITVAGAARAELRVLKIYHLHTHEKAEIAFKKDGHYLPDGLKKLDYILRDWRRNETVRMDPRLFDLLWAVYQKSSSNDYIDVVCGYRASETNELLRASTRGVAKKSQHTMGRAIDFFIPGVPLKKLREIGLKMQGGGVGYYPTSGSPFVHMDVGNPRYWPRMDRQQLLAVFPGGKSLYLPADGKPLPRYEEALADYKARNGAPDVQLALAGAKRHGFFAFLFGGGTDEQEDEQETVVSQPAAPKQPALVADAGAKENNSADTAPAGEPATIIAALPSHGVPLPLRAPRAEVVIAQAATDDAVDRLSSGDAGDERESDEPVMAAVPIPAWRPDHAVPVLMAAATKREREGAGASAKPAVDPMMAILAPKPDAGVGTRTDPQTTAAIAAFTAQMSGSGTGIDAQGALADKARTFAMLPQPRPRYEPTEDGKTFSAAIFRPDDRSGRGDRLVPHTRSVSSGSPRSVAANASHSGASQRFSPAPVEEAVVRWALGRHRSFNPAIADRVAPALAYGIVHTPPRQVYTDGFRPDGQVEDAEHFKGEAVTFLPVARFGAD